MTAEKKLHAGRTAFLQSGWADAYAQLSLADKESPLQGDDLELLAVASYLLGKFSESHDIWSRAHNEHLNTGDIRCAARCAFWLGFTLLNAGESARGGGWIGRARRLLDEAQLDCAEQGYLLLPAALRLLGEGDARGALDIFDHAGAIGDRFQDTDLMTLTRLGRGQSLIQLGEAHQGLDLLDEAMAAVDSGIISPVVVGIIYCAVIEACLEIFDLRRAHEWTEALSDWCASQPDLVPFRGQCLIRRSEIMQLHGEWPDAMEEANRASELLSTTRGDSAAGAAFYQLGELYRLRGDFLNAEEAYRQAGNWRRSPQPGLALLRLAQSQVDTAKISIHRALEDSKTPKARTRILPAYVEIMIEAKELPKARAAADELIKLGLDMDAPLLQALAAQADGAVLLSQGETTLALDRLHHALAIWNRLAAPYECARVRFLIGKASDEIGDKETMKMEFEGARLTFRQLKAQPDIDRVDALMRNKKTRKNHGLTSRELQVLRSIATGKTNKTIAAELFVSERTVDRHVSNILSKLNLPSRAAATAFAYEHGLT